MKKICTGCKIEKELSSFSVIKKTGNLMSKCIECDKIYKIEYNKTHQESIKKSRLKYSINNAELIKERGRIYGIVNREEILKKHKIYYQENKEIINEKNKIYASEHKESVAEYKKEWGNKESSKEKAKIYRDENKEILGKKSYARKKERLKNDPFFKFTENIRSCIYQAIYRNNFTKNSKTAEILGCTFEEFKLHIENQFLPWMNWDNYGLYNGEFEFGWDLDHIIPISSALTYDEIIKLNHHTNFQPLCSYTNRYIKKDNYVLPV